MKMENIMSRKRLIRTGFPYDAYKYIDKPGQYMAILDAKCWRHNNLLLFFTLTDYDYKITSDTALFLDFVSQIK